uniref:ATP synthase F0 subunit 8 n=1 Tax=Laevapex fuscus TaxID=240816 RepID=A0A8F8FG61_9GAST|nr:ATP synthase F0 subunit 8 [Laevapex fuscus]
MPQLTPTNSTLMLINLIFMLVIFFSSF